MINLIFSPMISQVAMLCKWNKKALFVEISAKLCFIISPRPKQWLFLALHISHAVAEMLKYSSQIEIVFDATLSLPSRGSINSADWYAGRGIPSKILLGRRSEILMAQFMTVTILCISKRNEQNKNATIGG